LPSDAAGKVFSSAAEFCAKELSSVAIVRFQMAKESVTSVRQDVRVTFAGQLSDLGGLVALFTGMSILSLVEVVVWTVKMLFDVISCGKFK